MRSRLLLLLALVAGASFTCAGDAPSSALTDEDRRAFAWFDGLGLPGTAGKPRVLVHTGRSWTDDEEVEHFETFEGFLLAERPDEFEVLTTDLFVKRVLRKAPTSGKDAMIERVDLAARASARLAELRKPPPDDPADPRGSRLFVRFGERLGERAELLALARHCAEHGLDGLAHELVAEARKVPNLRDSHVDGRPIEQVAADEMATSMIWRHTLDFGEPSVPRSKLLEEFRAFVASFPRSEHIDRAKETVALLERMLREDAEHAKSVKPLDSMSKDERIAELIWRLRDAPGGQLMQPGSPHFFDEDEAKNPTALAQLVALGHDAVPQLIEAIEDVRFTRCVGFWRDFMFSHYVQRVGDAALQALQTIAGQRFWQGTYTAAAMVKDGQAAEVRERVEAWWADYRTKGEKQVLVALVAEGGMNAAGALAQLSEKYPDAAAAAALQALRASSGAARCNLLETVRRVDDPAVTALLVELAESDPDPDSRALAGQDALERGHLEVVPAMVDLWRQARTDSSGAWMHRSTIVTSLVRCGAPEGIAALGERLGDIEPRVASDVAEHAGFQLRFLPKLPGYPAKSLRAVEALVASLLDDTRETGVSSSGTRTVRERVCDEAAKQLAVVWGRSFRWDAEEEARDEQLLELRNLWRERQGLPKLAPPAPIRMDRVPDDSLRPLLDRLVAAPDDTAAADSLVALGLGALPGVREAIDRLAPDHVARAPLLAVARRLAVVVRESGVDDGSAPPPSEIATLLASLKGRPLTSQALCDLFVAAAKSVPPLTRSVEVAADLKPDGTGFVVRLRISKGDESLAKSPDRQTDMRLSVGNADKYGPCGIAHTDGGPPRDEDLRGLREAVDAVFADPPSARIAVRISATAR